MALDEAAKKELSTLRAKRDTLDRKIRGLEQYLNIKHKSSTKLGEASVVSARSIELDVKPDIQAIFAANGNQPIKYKKLVDMVAGKYSDTPRNIVDAKVSHVKRTLLESAAYGVYRLKDDTTKT